MKEIQSIFKRILVASDEDMLYKTIFELMASLTEEIGELSRELLIEEKSFGNTYKQSEEGSKAEAVDVVIAALAVFYARGGTTKFFIDKANEKLDKWEKNQGRNSSK